MKVDNLADEVQRYLSMGSWFQIFDITDPADSELALEVLATFENKKGKVSWHRPDALSFQIFGEAFCNEFHIICNSNGGLRLRVHSNIGVCKSPTLGYTVITTVAPSMY